MLGRDDFKNLTILVTGAAHGLGRSAIEYLQQLNVKVVATGRNQEIGDYIEQQGIPFIAQDLSTLNEESALRLFKDIDVIWHCAARSADWGAYEAFYQDNVIATTALATFAVKFGVKAFVHISTSSIYFSYQTLQRVTETYRPNQLVNHYAQTKWQAEEELAAFKQTQPLFNYVVLRPRAIFGQYDRVLLPKIRTLLEENNGKIPLPRGGKAEIDITYVKNVCYAMQLATQKLYQNSAQVNGGVYNISNGTPIAVRTLIEKVCTQILDIPCRVIAVPYMALHCIAKLSEWKATLLKQTPKFTCYGIGVLNYDVSLDLSLAQEVLEYHPIYSIDEGIHDMLKDKMHG